MAIASFAGRRFVATTFEQYDIPAVSPDKGGAAAGSGVLGAGQARPAQWAAALRFARRAV
jgi:hypothetical protein